MILVNKNVGKYFVLRGLYGDRDNCIGKFIKYRNDKYYYKYEMKLLSGSWKDSHELVTPYQIIKSIDESKALAILM